jgi:hypothetical protein
MVDNKRLETGIKIPMTMKPALKIDLKTGPDFWRWAIKKETKKVFPAFQILFDGNNF